MQGKELIKTINFQLSRRQTVEVAHAEAERIRLIGGSEAGAIECVGKAEAEKMRLKASAYKQYGEAAMLALVLETLPKVRHQATLVAFILSLNERGRNMGELKTGNWYNTNCVCSFP